MPSKKKAPWRAMMQTAKVPEIAVIVAAVKSVEPRPISHQELQRRFHLGPEQERAFKKMMKALVREGLLDRLKGKRYLLPDPNRRLALADSSEADDGAEDDDDVGSGVDVRATKALEITETEASSVDTKVSEDRRVRAKLFKQGHLFFALPVGEHEGGRRDKGGLRAREDRILIPQKYLGKAKAGDLVMVQVVEPARGDQGGRKEAIGKILSGFRREADFGEVSHRFFREYGLFKGYPRKAAQEAEAAPEPAYVPDGTREDLRGIFVCTIDPSTARDHDDAISLERLDGREKAQWRLGVHIADVSEYVVGDSELDREALRRSFTQYLPWTAVPMLPERLSTDLCSLREGHERLAFSCFMDVNASGELVRFRFVETFIKVSKFYSYEEAQAAKDGGDPFLTSLHDFTQTLQAVRKRDGQLEFSFPEPKFECDDAGTPVRVVLGERLASHGWIEECMLLCNQAAAKYLTKNKLPGLFRVHEQPDLEVVAELFSVQSPHQRDAELAKTFEELRETKGFLNPAVQRFYARLLSPENGPLPPAVQRKILMSMKKAQYASQALGHFALGWLHYAHFTSPIRRYPDLWIHRVMKEHLRGKKQFKDEKLAANAIADEVSEREIAVMKVERKGHKTATAWILQQHIGREFTATINGVEAFGLFVAIQDPYGEGMIPVASLGDDFFVKDETTYSLVGKRTRKTYSLGQSLAVRLVRCNPFSGQIDFEPVGVTPRESGGKDKLKGQRTSKHKPAGKTSSKASGKSGGKANAKASGKRKNQGRP
jgi:ribonuclease R